MDHDVPVVADELRTDREPVVVFSDAVGSVRVQAISMTSSSTFTMQAFGGPVWLVSDGSDTLIRSVGSTVQIGGALHTLVLQHAGERKEYVSSGTGPGAATSAQIAVSARPGRAGAGEEPQEDGTSREEVRARIKACLGDRKLTCSHIGSLFMQKYRERLSEAVSDVGCGYAQEMLEDMVNDGELGTDEDSNMSRRWYWVSGSCAEDQEDDDSEEEEEDDDDKSAIRRKVVAVIKLIAAMGGD